MDTGRAAVVVHCGDMAQIEDKTRPVLCAECIHDNYPEKQIPACPCSYCCMEKVIRYFGLTPERAATAAFFALKRVHPAYDPATVAMDAQDTMLSNVMGQIAGMGKQEQKPH